jgi:hypothetical protein
MAKTRLCSIEGCGKPVNQNGYCNSHYLRWYRHGDPLKGGKPRVRQSPICRIEGCGKRSQSYSLCPAHYWRLRTFGDPQGGGLRAGDPMRFVLHAARYTGPDCLLWPYATSSGYGVIRQGGRNRRATHLVCERAHGPSPSKEHVVAHSCGNGHLGCVTPHHLRWATQLENVADSIGHGTWAKGERLPQTKLRETDIPIVRALLRDGRTQASIADQFGVSISCINQIKRNKAWRWVA